MSTRAMLWRRPLARPPQGRNARAGARLLLRRNRTAAGAAAEARRRRDRSARRGRSGIAQAKPALVGNPIRFSAITTGQRPVKEACTRWSPRIPVSHSHFGL